MNEWIYSMFLWLVVAWPLFLIIPALYTRLPLVCHLAILPAAVLLVLPGEAAQILTWVVFRTGLIVDNETRWLLAMTVTVWFVVATIMKSQRRDETAHGGVNIFFLITLAGNLGAILAMDMVGFYIFSALMGYGLYGLLVQGKQEAAQGAGKLYLIFMIMADLVLFEALLLAAFAIEGLHFESVHQAIAISATSPIYMWMVLTGFTLKAGAWPAHLWVVTCIKNVPRSVALLLGGVPVVVGLLGIVRWLPLGESAFDSLGMAMQVLGVLALFYAILRFITCISIIALPTWGVVAVSGLFYIVVGEGLNDPDLWQQYEHFAYPLLALLGIFFAVLIIVIGYLHDRRLSSDESLHQVDSVQPWLLDWLDILQRWVAAKLSGVQSFWRASQKKVVDNVQQIRNWENILDTYERRLQHWSVAIILLTLLGMTIVLLVLV